MSSQIEKLELAEKINEINDTIQETIHMFSFEKKTNETADNINLFATIKQNEKSYLILLQNSKEKVNTDLKEILINLQNQKLDLIGKYYPHSSNQTDETVSVNKSLTNQVKKIQKLIIKLKNEYLNGGQKHKSSRRKPKQKTRRHRRKSVRRNRRH